MNDVRLTGKAFTRFLVFFLIVVIVILGALGWQVEQRNDAINEIRDAAERIEEAATNTEEVLVEVIEEQRTPEAQAQAQRVREALEEIAVIRRLLCELPELANMPACPSSDE